MLRATIRKSVSPFRISTIRYCRPKTKSVARQLPKIIPKKYHEYNREILLLSVSGTNLMDTLLSLSWSKYPIVRSAKTKAKMKEMKTNHTSVVLSLANSKLLSPSKVNSVERTTKNKIESFFTVFVAKFATDSHFTSALEKH
jgi:hypothetical protein